jgi:hypothetical protein
VEVLKDQHRFKIPRMLADGFDPEQRDAVERQLQPRDSKAYPRTGRAEVVDSQGGTLGLHKPGWRCASGGTPGDHWLRDGLHDEAQLAYADYEDRISNAWRGRDGNGEEAGHYNETSARRSVIPTALLKRPGVNPDDVDDYVEDLDDDELDADLDEHVAAFEADNGGRQTDAARDQKARIELERLYQQRDAELREAWRGRK